MARFFLVAVLGILLLASCGSEPEPTLDLFDPGETDDLPTPTEPASETPSPDDSPTLLVVGVEEALETVWSYLSRCFSLDQRQLEVHQLKGNWYVKASTGDVPQRYGIWKVYTATGELEPQDPLARDLTGYLESECRADKVPSALLPTATPSPPPSATPEPTPTSTPVAQSVDEARNLVWVYLGRCLSFDPSELEGYRVIEDWFIKSNSEKPENYGLWKVDASAGIIAPHDILARNLKAYIESKCNSDVYLLLFPPDPTVTPSPTPTLTPVPTPTPTSVPTPTPTSTPVPTLTPTPSPMPTLTPTPTPSPTPTSTPIPKITTTEDAESALWAHLVKCFRDLEKRNLDASWNPRNLEWIVITTGDPVTDCGVWRVQRVDGTITPDNRLARIRDQQAREPSC